MGQPLPQMVESEVLPHILTIDHESGKVSLHVYEDPGGRAHDKAQSQPQDAHSPEPPCVVPEPKPQEG